MKRVIIVTLATFAGLVSVAGEPDAIVRVDASGFVGLPESVRSFIASSGCLVPQPAEVVHERLPPVNVVRGAFAKEGQLDWAIVCSRFEVSSILILWGGPAQCSTPIAARPDRDFLQDLEFTSAGFSREIRSVSPAQIRASYEAYEEPPPEVHHDAVEDAFIGKGSVHHYCDSGRWVTLHGAD